MFDDEWVPLFGAQPKDRRLKQARALLGPDGSDEDAQAALDVAKALDALTGGDDMYAGAEYASYINHPDMPEPRDYLIRYYAVSDLFRRAKRTMH